MTGPARLPFRSESCTSHHFHYELYDYWCEQIKEPKTFHRKQWEFVYISQALHERGLLQEGSRGLGFGVGREPLVSLFASRGCSIVATDLAADEVVNKGWAETGQHAASLEVLNTRGICDPKVFSARATFRPVDMNNIPSDLEGFDFCWSACALEHLGSLQNGAVFVEKSVDTLRPGGIAVHTTEYNLTSDNDTVSTGNTVLYRHRDIMALIKKLRDAGHKVEPLMIHLGSTHVDKHIDLPPYQGPQPHLRIRLGSYAITSVGLIIQRGEKK